MNKTLDLQRAINYAQAQFYNSGLNEYMTLQEYIKEFLYFMYEYYLESSQDDLTNAQVNYNINTFILYLHYDIVIEGGEYHD